MIGNYAKDEIEKSRKRAHFYQCFDGCCIGFAGLVALALFIKFITIFMNGGKPESIWLPTMIAILVIGLLWGTVKKKYTQELDIYVSLYKKYLVRAVLEEQLEDVEYIGEHGFSQQQIDNFQLIARGNKYGSEDYLKAGYRGTIFETSDVLVMHKHPKEVDITFFRGRMIQLPYHGIAGVEIKIFSKDFKFRLDSKAVLVDFLGIEQRMVGADTSTQIKTNDSAFDRRFDVFCANEQGAEALLTPILMERLKQLHSKYESLAFRFTENTLYVAINSNENYFKRYPDQPIDYKSETKKLISEIDEIKWIVDLLIME